MEARKRNSAKEVTEEPLVTDTVNNGYLKNGQLARVPDRL